ncbi:DUF2625 family protein [Amycolatopsis pittospori]|uniref:DUF2625 family protein n=1 Tax=Amycolatopsis pittospori TaxID=2749434 RepID=UPI001F3B46AA
MDHGWLRVLGSGTEPLPNVLSAQDLGPGRLTVAYDVLDGRFAWIAEGDGNPRSATSLRTTSNGKT